MKSKYENQIINNLKVIRTITMNKNKKGQYFELKCLKCGKIQVKSRKVVYDKQCKCECSYKRAKHIDNGKTRLNNIYFNMKARCYNSNQWNYQYYGGRGIKVCDEWKNNYNSFYNWALENGYQDNLSIDRIDTNGNYEPSNCRWVTDKEQKNNTRRNHYITYKGKTQSMSKWAEELNISYTTLRSRINTNKWSIEKAFTTPVNSELKRDKNGRFI